MDKVNYNHYEYVECPICGKHYQELGWRHLKYSHNLTKESFLQDYPDFVFRCGKLIDKVNKINREISDRDSVRKKRSAKMIYNYANTGLREVTRQKSLDLWKDDEYRDKVVNALIESHKDPEVLRKITQSSSDRWSDPDYHKRVSKKIRETQNLKEKRDLMRVKSTNNWFNKDFLDKQILGYSNHTHKKGNSELLLRSGWEKTVCEYLDQMGLDYEYEKYRFNYTYNKINKIYIPDFYIKSIDLFLEVKPVFKVRLDDSVMVKLNAVIEQGKTIILITDDHVSDFSLFEELIKTYSSTTIPDMGVDLKWGRSAGCLRELNSPMAMI